MTFDDEYMRKRIKDYGAEFGVESFTLERLIDSHRHLRTLNMEHNALWLETLRQARERGEAEGRQKAMEQDFISRESLMSMTIAEIIERFGKD